MVSLSVTSSAPKSSQRRTGWEKSRMFEWSFFCLGSVSIGGESVAVESMMAMPMKKVANNLCEVMFECPAAKTVDFPLASLSKNRAKIQIERAIC